MARLPLETRRRQLVEAAIRAMTRDGVARTTTRSIVAEADVSLSVFHYCFDSKESLIEAVMETITDHSAGPVLTGTPAGGTVRETLRGMLQIYWDHVVANPDEHMLTYELTQYAARQPGFEHLSRRQYERYAERLTAAIELVRASTGVALTVPDAVLARYLSVVIDGLTLNYLVLGDPEGAEAVLDSVADHVAGLAQ